MSAQHKANRYAFQAATNRFWQRPTDEHLSQVEAALEQVKFDRMEVETDPGPTDESPSNDPDQAEANPDQE